MKYNDDANTNTKTSINKKNKLNEQMACRELIKGGGLSIDKLTEERAPLS